MMRRRKDYSSSNLTKIRGLVHVAYSCSIGSISYTCIRHDKSNQNISTTFAQKHTLVQISPNLFLIFSDPEKFTSFTRGHMAAMWPSCFSEAHRSTSLGSPS